MSFLTAIKLGNVTNLSDARYAAAVGINYIGFCFDPAHENYIAPIKAKEMIDWITGSNIVAEFGNQTLAEIKDISELLNVDAIELFNNILPDELLLLEKPVIKKIDISQLSFAQAQIEIAAYKNNCDAFHIFCSGTHALNSEQLMQLCSLAQIIWGLDISNSNIMQIIETYKPFAIHVSGGNEEKTGIKDFDELNELLETIQIEE